MKRIFTKISAFLLVAAAVCATACLDDETKKSTSNGGSEPVEPTIPGNSVIDARVFEALDLDRPELAAVKTYYQADQYYLAAQALLEYYRNRTEVVNPNVNLIAPSISPEEQAWADYALPVTEGTEQDGYRFYVEGYLDGDKPYSFQKSSKLDWTVRNAAEAEERYRLHRLAWMVPMGKAYRTSLDETYTDEWIKIYESWRETFPRPEGEGLDYEADPATQPEEGRDAFYAWRPIDVAYRVEGQCDLLYYFMQSASFTPQLLASFLGDLAEQAQHVADHYSADSELQAKQAHAVFRAGTIFPEMKQAPKWVESGSGSMNEGIDASVFEVLVLEYSGLTKVKRAYDMGDYYMALEELMNYYRSRTHGLNPNVDLQTAAPTDNDRRWADYALRENGYRFYVNNYYDAAAGDKVPYSYMNDEGTGIDWTKCPTGDQEQRYQLHRHQWMVPQAKTYYDSGDEKYVQNWMEVYADWIRQNPKPEQGTDVTNHSSWRPLDVAARLIDQCALLEYYQNSESVTVEWLCEVLKRLDEHANHILNNYSTTSNHLITQAQAVTFAGMLFPELKNAATWKQSGTGVLSREVTAQYFPDGWLMDGDLHYHISGIEDFRISLEVAQRNGEQSRFPESYVSSMRKMTDVVMNMIYPDYTVPNMADTRRETWTQRVLQRNLNNYYTLFPDNQEMLWMATGGTSGTMPETRVKTFPDAGYYVMRTGWTKDDMMMVLQNTPDGPSEQWHRQSDNNTFELWVRGRNFFPDSGCFSYGGTSESNAQRRKYAASSAHNTLTLDGKNVASDGRMRKQESRSTSTFTYEVLVLENPSYENLTHRRVVFLVDNKFYVLLDEAIGTAEGTVNLNFNVTEGSESQVVLDAAKGGFHTAFADGNNLFVTTYAPKKGIFERMDGFVSYNINKSSERQAYRLNVDKTAEESLYFVTLMVPAEDAAAVEASVNSLDVTSTGGTVRLEVGGRSYKLSYTL